VKFVKFVDASFVFSFRARVGRGLYLFRRAAKFVAQKWAFPQAKFPKPRLGGEKEKSRFSTAPRVCTPRFVCEMMGEA